MQKYSHDKSIVSFFQILVEESGNRLHCCLEEEILLYKIKNYTSQFLFNQETVTSSTRINLTRREGILIALYSRIKHIYIEKFSIQYRIVHVEKKRKERHDRHLTNKFFDVPIPGTEGRERC